MSIEVTLKLLSGDKFQVQANPEETIADLKAKVAQARPELPVECQKLIYSGKILADEVTVQDSGYQSTGFIVAMATKAKAPAKPPAATPAEAPAATPAPTPTPAVTTPAVPPADAPLNEASVQSLCEMGFPRDQVEAALRASPGQNTMIAVEFLMTGIPEGGDAEMPAALPFPYGPGPGGPGDGGDEPMPEVLSQLRNNPQFGQLAAMIAQNPQMLDQVLRGVQQTHPEIAQAIQEHPDAFMRLLREATGGALQPEEDDGFVGPGGATREQLAALTAMLQQHPEMLEQLLPDIEAQDPQMAEVIRQNPQRLIDHLARFGQGRGGGAAAPGMPGMPGAGGMPGGEVIRLTEEENAAVERLAALGFPKEMAAQAYLACDKSEELAANFLFDNAGN